MATTAGQMVKAILNKLIVSEAEAPLSAPEVQDTIFAMNNYMTALDADGISIGYTEVSGTDDVLTSPPGANLGIICNVAMAIADEYGAAVTVSPLTVKTAEMGLSAMRKLGRNIQPMIFPGTMPLGSGNEDYWNDGRHFFSGPEEQITTETGRNILIESDTDVS